MTWHRSIAWALVGEDLDLPATAEPAASELVAELTSRGWDADAIRAHALQALSAEQPWPHPVPDALRADLGAAQWYAALGRARELLGVDTLLERAPSTRRALTADERRLLADAPPHYGTG